MQEEDGRARSGSPDHRDVQINAVYDEWQLDFGKGILCTHGRRLQEKEWARARLCGAATPAAYRCSAIDFLGKGSIRGTY